MARRFRKHSGAPSVVRMRIRIGTLRSFTTWRAISAPRAGRMCIACFTLGCVAAEWRRIGRSSCMRRWFASVRAGRSRTLGRAEEHRRRSFPQPRAGARPKRICGGWKRGFGRTIRASNRSNKRPRSLVRRRREARWLTPSRPGASNSDWPSRAGRTRASPSSFAPAPARRR